MLSTAQSPGTVSAAQGSSAKYLLFRLGAEQFGIDVMCVREIVPMHPLTAIPNSPPSLSGVINLRGRVVPVTNLRLRFDMMARELDRRTCLIVVAVGSGDEQVLSALAVDSVSEVARVPDDEIDDPPSAQGSAVRPYLRGLARIDDSVTVLLDVQKLGSGVVDPLSLPVGAESLA